MATKKPVRYVDGFVIAVPKKSMKFYTKIAKVASKVWMDHGALEYRETVGDDLGTKFGLPFPKLTKLKSNEVVIFSWISYKSKAHRNKVNAAVMKDPRMLKSMGDCEKNMPFMAKRMSYGGFSVFVKE